MSRSPLPRPTLIPGISRIWRDPHTLQLGVDPARAVLLDLPDPGAARVLDLLDGARPERAVLRRAAERGIAPDDARALLDTLWAAGFVLPAPALLPALADEARRRLTGEAAALAIERASARLPMIHARALAQAAGRSGPRDIPAEPVSVGTGHGRSPVPAARTADAGPATRSPAAVLRRRLASKVVITGRGRVGAGLAVALAEAGVGHVHPDLPGTVTVPELPGGPLRGADVGSARREAVVAALEHAVPGVETRPVRRGTATMVVHLGSDRPTALVAATYATRRQPHLAVTLQDGVAVVGPFVPPSGAPCLLCVELHRRDRDARRPEPVDRLDPADVEPCPVATLLMATGFAAAEVLAFLDGGVPETTGASVEITTPGRLRRRTWTPHPACGCGRSRLRRGARRPPGERPPPGQRPPPGERLPPGQHPLPGERLPPGQHPPPGERLLPGQHPPPGERRPPGQHPPPGERPGASERLPPDRPSPPSRPPSPIEHLPPGVAGGGRRRSAGAA